MKIASTARPADLEVGRDEDQHHERGDDEDDVGDHGEHLVDPAAAVARPRSRWSCPRGPPVRRPARPTRSVAPMPCTNCARTSWPKVVVPEGYSGPGRDPRRPDVVEGRVGPQQRARRPRSRSRPARPAGRTAASSIAGRSGASPARREGPGGRQRQGQRGAEGGARGHRPSMPAGACPAPGTSASAGCGRPSVPAHPLDPAMPTRARGSTITYTMSMRKLATRTPMMTNRKMPWSRKTSCVWIAWRAR